MLCLFGPVHWPDVSHKDNWQANDCYTLLDDVGSLTWDGLTPSVEDILHLVMQTLPRAVPQPFLETTGAAGGHKKKLWQSV